MSNIVIRLRSKTSVSDAELYDLAIEAFAQWTERGLESPSLHRSLEDFKKIIRRTVMHVAQDAVTGELLGMRCHSIDRKKKCIYDFYLSVSPKAKRMGIATLILEAETQWAKNSSIKYLWCTTAVNAEWSVRWHLKNGYRIIGYKRSVQNNYSQYVFRKQLVPSLLWDSAFFCRCCYLVSYATTWVVKDKNGKLKLIGRIVKRIMND